MIPEPFSMNGNSVSRFSFLTEADLPSLQALLERCSDYYQMLEGRATDPGEAASLLEDRPPGRPADSKILLGFYNEQDRLIGVLDACRNYPEPGTWFIGLLLLEPDCRNGGTGARIYREFERMAAEAGARRIDLGVVAANPAAARFWQRRGFRLVERQPPRRFGPRRHVVEIWRREPLQA